MTTSITIELVQRGEVSLTIRGVRHILGRPELTSRTDTRRVRVGRFDGLDEQSLWELVSSIEQEVISWRSRLPLEI